MEDNYTSYEVVIDGKVMASFSDADQAVGFTRIAHQNRPSVDSEVELYKVEYEQDEDGEYISLTPQAIAY